MLKIVFNSRGNQTDVTTSSKENLKTRNNYSSRVMTQICKLGHNHAFLHHGRKTIGSASDRIVFVCLSMTHSFQSVLKYLTVKVYNHINGNNVLQFPYLKM